ncbi:MAG: excinuclease ABC subunit UvrC [Chlamydiota bacterium]
MITPDTLKKFPRKPGVYLMKGAGGEVLYVGKAVDLRRRVESYFTGRGDGRAAIPAMVSRADEVDFIVTDTENEALLLEETLIKEHRPRYNVSLKDAGACAHIRLSVDEEYPRMEITRHLRRDGARWFGPYSSANDARRTVRFLQRAFPLRDCGTADCARRARPCIKHQIGRCSGPCRGLIGKRDYAALVRRVDLFLSGRTGSLLRELGREMRRESAALRFEKAREIRDTIGAIERTLERQKCVSFDGVDRDAVGLHREGGRGEAALLFVRGGRLIGKRTISISGGGDDPSLVGEILRRHHLGGAFVPPEILVPALPPDSGALGEALAGARGGRVGIAAPRRGAKRELVAMAASNAAASFAAGAARGRADEEVRGELARRFRLPSSPRDIECVDISHLGGASRTGSMVAFRDGAPRPEGYRRFTVKSAEGADDCGMIYEVVARRARRGREGWKMPDLIVVDGGKGQMHAALRALRDEGAEGPAVIALAKERELTGRRAPERVYIGGRKDAIPLKAGDPAALFLQRVRDEAHRFALRGHRAMRTRRLFESELDRVAGVGPARRAALIRAFGDIRGVAAAPPADLARVLGDRALARRVLEHLSGVRGNPAADAVEQENRTVYTGRVPGGVRL